MKGQNMPACQWGRMRGDEGLRRRLGCTLGQQAYGLHHLTARHHRQQGLYVVYEEVRLIGKAQAGARLAHMYPVGGCRGGPLRTTRRTLHGVVSVHGAGLLHPAVVRADVELCHPGPQTEEGQGQHEGDYVIQAFHRVQI